MSQQQFLPQQWGHGPSSIADDINSIAPPPPHFVLPHLPPITPLPLPLDIRLSPGLPSINNQHMKMVDQAEALRKDGRGLQLVVHLLQLQVSHRRWEFSTI